MCDRYPYSQQDRDYRAAARDAGCTCPDLPAHVHRLACPLFDHLAFEKSPAADIPAPRPQNGGSPEDGASSSATPSPSQEDGPDQSSETEPGGATAQAGLDSPPGAGAFGMTYHELCGYFEALDQREEDHAEERRREQRGRG